MIDAFILITVATLLLNDAKKNPDKSMLISAGDFIWGICMTIAGVIYFIMSL